MQAPFGRGEGVFGHCGAHSDGPRDNPYSNGPEAEVLGWRIRRRPAAVSPKPERLWRARFALRGALARGKMRARELETLMGHLSFLCLIRHESL